jgi:ABC-type uncharacterized transport system permease subunit
VRPLIDLVAGGGLSVALAVALLALLAMLGGHDPGEVLAAMWRGSFGSRDAILSATLVRTTPLLLTGLAVALAFRAGVLNIGAEGQLLAGATAAAVVSLFLAGSAGRATLPLALLAGSAAGAAWALVPAWLRVRRGVLEVISTIMLNSVAVYAVGWLVRGPLQEPLHIYPQTPSIAVEVQLPILIPGTRLHWGFLVAILLAVALRVFLQRTASGFRVLVSGSNPRAAASAGRVDVARTTSRAFLASGALAGLAGAIELTGVTYALYENFSPGYGYTAIAVALLGGLDPLRVLGSAIFFGALEAGAGAMQRDAGVPSVLVSVIEALVLLAVIAIAWGRTRRADRARPSDGAPASPPLATPGSA